MTISQEILYLNPDEVVPDPDNPRGALRDVDEMARSIAMHGVLEPITIRYGHTEGTNGAQVPIVVRGHRRLAGARKAKADGSDRAQTIPCIPAGAESTDEQMRAVTRLVENLQRDDFNAVEEARGVQQLLDLGLDAHAIADELSVPEERVAGAVAIASSKATIAVAEKHDLSFDQALVIAEFDGDKETIKLLTVTAVKEPEEWPHVVAQARQERDEAALVAAAAAEWKAKGYRVLDERPPWGDKKVRRLDRIAAEKGAKKTLTEADHAECPGRAAYLRASFRGDVAEVELYCADWPANGHVDGDRIPTGSFGGSSSSTPKVEKSERERNEERIHRAAMKASRAALHVRREFVRNLLERKSIPSGLYQFAVESIMGYRLDDCNVEFSDLTRQKTTGHQQSWTAAQPAQLAFVKKVGSRLPLALFARVAAHVERHWESNTWKSDDPLRKAYLGVLVSAGYVPSLVEKVMLGQAKAPALLDEADRLKAAAKADAAARPAGWKAKEIPPKKAAPAKRAAKKRVVARRAPRPSLGVEVTTDAEDAAAIAERFDSAVPDGPEAEGAPHAPPPLPAPAPREVDTTNDFDVTVGAEAGDVAFTIVDGEDEPTVVMVRPTALRLAAWLVALADREEDGHSEFRQVLEAIEEGLA